MAKGWGWSSESATNRLLMIIALFTAILAFSLVYVVDSISHASASQAPSASQASLSGYFLSKSAATNAPDLVVLFPNDIYLKTGGFIKVKAKTQNNGNADSAASETRVTTPAGTDYFFGIPPLPPGASFDNEFTVKCNSEGTITVYGWSDFHGKVAESVESNIVTMQVNCV